MAYLSQAAGLVWKKIDQAYKWLCSQHDIIVLSKTRWRQRKAVALMNQQLAQLKLHKAADKTYIGKISKGFDFLGYRFDGQNLTLAAKTVRKMTQKWQQLYEQAGKNKPTSKRDSFDVGAFVRYLLRWIKWTTAGLNGVTLYGGENLTRRSQVLAG